MARLAPPLPSALYLPELGRERAREVIRVISWSKYSNYFLRDETFFFNNYYFE